MRKSQSVKVSVCIKTYNHASYISEAIESVLKQETNFEYEILIGEDDSSDGTRDLVKAYASKYPDRIRLLLNERKTVSYVDGKATAHRNVSNLLNEVRGDYVALFDGDDYWIDPLKLQKQVDLLNAKSHLSSCFTDTLKVYENSDRESHSSWMPFRASEYTIEDILPVDFVTAGTMMFRKSMLPELPEWFFDVPVADVPLVILLARRGGVGFLDEITTVYRKHDGGSWFSLPKQTKLETAIRIRERIMPHLDRNLVPLCHRYIYGMLLALVRLHVGEGSKRAAREKAGRLLLLVLKSPKLMMSHSGFRSNLSAGKQLLRALWSAV